MEQPVVLAAVRTPLGKRNGALAEIHPATLLGYAQRGALEAAGLDPAEVGQVVGGCVTQVGEQSYNITRTAWLAAGLPEQVAGSTVDAQCGSAQQALTLASALVGSGTVDIAMACGVEAMSRVPIGANYRKEFQLGRPVPKQYLERYEFTNQFVAAERMAVKWGVTRADADGFGLLSQQRAAQAWEQDRFAGQIVPVGDVARDGALRESTLEGLAGLKTVVEGGVHTAGTSSQISDGASAVIVASARRATELGIKPLARIVDSCLVGVDPVMMLTGPIAATPLLLQRNNLTMADIDHVEINEAFASVVLSWARECDADLAKVNPNGGAIALGHPLGATGCVLATKAIHELQRTQGRYALVTMCCGGGLGTGTLLERQP
ncbi:MAG TPA: steroid 3-ketoacyl-CoA thiolase [Micromonosporaceae bacterium]|nr:steroid 3-ketoacyl-CoA thiolase [Micromonosporaceae bacterium]